MQERNEDFTDDPAMKASIRSLLRAKTRSYRYVLPTQLLAKVVDPGLDSRCLQAGRVGGRGNFDARSVAHEVVVPFDRENGSPLGGSPEPYVNNPLRVPEVSPQHRRAQRARSEWDRLCDILQAVEEAPDTTLATELFDQTLLEIRRLQQELEISYPIPQRISLEGTMSLLAQFLAPRTGGRRLQAVSAALFKTLKEKWRIYDEVISAQVNVPDAPGTRPADIECRVDGKAVLAVEVKDRTVTLQLLTDQITSARMARVTELLFLVRAPQLIDSDEVPRRARMEFVSGQNIYLFDAESFFANVLGLLGEEGRGVFLEQVGHALTEYRLDFRDRRGWADLLARNWD